VQFQWLLSAISLRHSDSVDVRFTLRYDDMKIDKTVALSHPGLLLLSDRTGHPLTDPWCSCLAAQHLKNMVETGEDMDKALVTPSLEQLSECHAQLLAEAAV